MKEQNRKLERSWREVGEKLERVTHRLLPAKPTLGHIETVLNLCGIELVEREREGHKVSR